MVNKNEKIMPETKQEIEVKTKLNISQMLLLVIIAVAGTSLVLSMIISLGTTKQSAVEETTKIPKNIEEPRQLIGMANPAAVYCGGLEYVYEVRTDSDGNQYGVCIFPDKTECEEWEFLQGLCGEKNSYCAQQGYDLKIRDDGNNSLTPIYAVCVDRNGEDIGAVSELTNLLERSISSSKDPIDNKIVIDENVSLSLPSYFDWREYDGYDWMTEVKDQGKCGSCWSFATIGAIEANYNIRMNQPNENIDLSEQFLVSDCLNGFNTCCGGLNSLALNFLMSDGVPSETCMPYTDAVCGGENCCTEALENACNAIFEDPISCSSIDPWVPMDYWCEECSNSKCYEACSDNQNQSFKINNYRRIVPHTVSEVKRYLIEKGPLIVNMAWGWGVYDYAEGNNVYICDTSGWEPPINHAVVITGYDDYSGAWIVKNSWGYNWEYSPGSPHVSPDGYFKVNYGGCSIDSEFWYVMFDYEKQCSDGIDNDGDESVDMADGDCDFLGDNSEFPSSFECSDGIDNDGDHRTDLSDNQCNSSSDDDESTNFYYECSDGIDNDGDGKIDLGDDPECESLDDNDENTISLECFDGIDNDGDDRIDYPADPECGSLDDNSEIFPPPPPSSECNNGVDDDGDGKIDYQDLSWYQDVGCSTGQDNNESDYPQPPIDCGEGPFGDQFCFIERRGAPGDGTIPSNSGDRHCVLPIKYEGETSCNLLKSGRCVLNSNAYFSNHSFSAWNIPLSPPNEYLICSQQGDFSYWFNPDYYSAFCTESEGTWHVNSGDADVDNDYNPSGGIDENSDYCAYNLANGEGTRSTSCCCGDDTDEYYITGLDGTTACCDTENECVIGGVCQNRYDCNYLRTRLIRTDECSGNDCPTPMINDPGDSAYASNGNDCVFNGLYFNSGYNAGAPYATALDTSQTGRTNFLCYRGGEPDGAWEDCDLDRFTCSLCDQATDFGCDGQECYVAGGEDEPFGEYGGDGIHTVNELDCCGDDWGEYYTVGSDGTSACCNAPSETVTGGICQNECEGMFEQCQIDTDCCGILGCRQNLCVRVCLHDYDCPLGFECDTINGWCELPRDI